MLRWRVTRRPITLAVLAAGFLACCSVTSLIRTDRGSSGVAEGDRPPVVRLALRVDVGPLRSMSLSPGGRFFSTVGSDGTVTVYTSSGKKRFSANVTGASDAVLSHDGTLTMVYSRLDPTNGNLTFLDSAGRVCWRFRVAGAVWSADACSTSNGARFAVGTGGKHIYVIEIAGRRRKYRRWRVPGAVTSVAFTARGDQIVYATWQDSAIGRCTLHGANVWRLKADPSSLHQVEPLNQAADRILVRAVPVRFGAERSYILMDGAGDAISRGKLCAGERACVIASPNGRYLCLGTDKLIRHEGKSMRERHAVLLEASGRVLCDKGSPFFQADPVLVTAEGYVLLRSPRHELFTMSPTGQLKPTLKLPAPVDRVVASRDGSLLLIRCLDSGLYLLSVSHKDAATAPNQHAVAAPTRVGLVSG